MHTDERVVHVCVREYVMFVIYIRRPNILQIIAAVKPVNR